MMKKEARDAAMELRDSLKKLEDILQEYMVACFAGFTEPPAGYSVKRYAGCTSLVNEAGTIIADIIGRRIEFTIDISFHDIEELLYSAESYFEE